MAIKKRNREVRGIIASQAKRIKLGKNLWLLQSDITTPVRPTLPLRTQEKRTQPKTKQASTKNLIPHTTFKNNS